MIMINVITTPLGKNRDLRHHNWIIFLPVKTSMRKVVNNPMKFLVPEIRMSRHLGCIYSVQHRRP